MIGQVFFTKEELCESVKSFYKDRGLLLKIGKHSDHRRVIFLCMTGEKYVQRTNGPTTVRNTGTKLGDCPFFVKGHYLKKDKCWKVYCIQEQHNHELLQHHYTSKKLPIEQKIVVSEMSKNGATTASILSTIQTQFSNNVTTKKDVLNVIAKDRQLFLNKRTPIVALYESLPKENFVSEVKVDANGVVIGLFFAHKQSLELAVRFRNVFIMDATYKTNRYNMPLLNIVGITSTYSTFNVAFFFLKEETTTEYSWALQVLKKFVTPKLVATDRELALIHSLKSVYTNLQHVLCQWHINKNVLANTKKLFVENGDFENFISMWNHCIHSTTTTSFEHSWQILANFSETNEWQAAIQYLQTTWLPHKHNFVMCWVSKLMHIGTTSTSRGEGNHSVLKKYIRISTGNLLMVFERLHLMLKTQFIELKQKEEHHKITISHKTNKPYLKHLHGKVSRFALDKIADQAENAKFVTTRDKCTQIFTSTWGLPCKHRFFHLFKSNELVNLNEISSQWYLFNPEEVVVPEVINLSPRQAVLKQVEKQLYDEPSKAATFISRINQLVSTDEITLEPPTAVTKKRGRPLGSKTKSTKRNPSHFEYVIGRKCRNCRQTGHNSATCRH